MSSILLTVLFWEVAIMPCTQLEQEEILPRQVSDFPSTMEGCVGQHFKQSHGGKGRLTRKMDGQEGKRVEKEAVSCGSPFVRQQRPN